MVVRVRFVRGRFAFGSRESHDLRELIFRFSDFPRRFLLVFSTSFFHSFPIQFFRQKKTVRRLVQVSNGGGMHRLLILLLGRCWSVQPCIVEPAERLSGVESESESESELSESESKRSLNLTETVCCCCRVRQCAFSPHQSPFSPHPEPETDCVNATGCVTPTGAFPRTQTGPFFARLCLHRDPVQSHLQSRSMRFNAV
jgi:hypothetical protein